MKKNILETLKKHKWAFFMIIIIALIYLINQETGEKAISNSASNFKSMLEVLPPILMLTGLLDVWVPKETMIKYMGKDSGIKGFAIALFLGSLAAGPLYAGFPIAAILIKKDARLANVLFFLGAWSTTKLPIFMYEFTSFGGKFTFTHVISNLIMFLIAALILEKILSRKTVKEFAVSKSI